MKPFIVEGYLNLESQEGGYSAPDWTVDGSGISDAVAQHFGIGARPTTCKGGYRLPYDPDNLPVGRVRLTIERI